MAAYVDTLRLLAQPELAENRTARKSDTKEIKNKHSSRPEGGAEMGTGAERTRVAVAGPRLAECGTNRTVADPVATHLLADKPRGPDSEWQRTGQAERWVAPRGPTFTHR